jgi:hypothetical protein
MKPDVLARFCLGLAAVGFVLVGAWGQSLIRKDLLKEKPDEIELPRRDIFSPRTTFAPLGISPPGEPLGGQIMGDKKTETPPAMDPSEPSLDLSYIGYIQSDHKMIALIILDGQALAVSVGEEILPGVKLEKVTPDGVDIIGPDSKRLSFPRQGEQQ